jgi:hypothetical protein
MRENSNQDVLNIELRIQSLVELKEFIMNGSIVDEIIEDRIKDLKNELLYLG